MKTNIIKTILLVCIVFFYSHALFASHPSGVMSYRGDNFNRENVFSSYSIVDDNTILAVKGSNVIAEIYLDNFLHYNGHNLYTVEGTGIRILGNRRGKLFGSALTNSGQCFWNGDIELGEALCVDGDNKAWLTGKDRNNELYIGNIEKTGKECNNGNFFLAQLRPGVSDVDLFQFSEIQDEIYSREILSMPGDSIILAGRTGGRVVLIMTHADELIWAKKYIDGDVVDLLRVDEEIWVLIDNGETTVLRIGLNGDVISYEKLSIEGQPFGIEVQDYGDSTRYIIQGWGFLRDYFEFGSFLVRFDSSFQVTNSTLRSGWGNKFFSHHYLMNDFKIVEDSAEVLMLGTAKKGRPFTRIDQGMVQYVKTYRLTQFGTGCVSSDDLNFSSYYLEPASVAICYESISLIPEPKSLVQKDAGDPFQDFPRCTGGGSGRSFNCLNSDEIECD